MNKRDESAFGKGVFSAMQYLVLTSDEPVLAKEIAGIHGIKRDEALALSKETGYQVRQMNKFIRDNLED